MVRNAAARDPQGMEFPLFSARMTLGACVVAAVLVVAAGGCEMEAADAPPPSGPVAPDPVRDTDWHPADRREPPRQSDVNDHYTGGGERSGAPPSDAADRVITEQIRATLATDEWLSAEARQVEVTTEDGVVTLHGRVETTDERYIVLDVAWETEGVRDVIDEIEVLVDDDSI